MRSILVMLMVETPVTQAQAGMNCLELSEFYCIHNSDKIVTLYSPPFVDLILAYFKDGEAKKKKKKKVAADSAAIGARDSLTSYMMRGHALDNESPYSLAKKGWTEEKKPEDDADDDDNHVSFLGDYSPERWIVRKTKKDRDADKTKIVVNVVRRKVYVTDEKQQNTWAVGIATLWREAKELKDRSWSDFAAQNPDRLYVIEMSKLLQNEILLSQKDTKKMEEEGDIINKGDEQKTKKSSKKAKKKMDAASKYDVMTDMRTEKRLDADKDMEVVVGGERGHAAVVAGRIAGLIPREQHKQVIERMDEEEDDDDEEEAAAGPFALDFDSYKEVKPPVEKMKDNVADDDDKDDGNAYLEVVKLEDMVDIVNKWTVSCKEFAEGNPEHKGALLTAMLYLADVLMGSKLQPTPFSLVVQGSGGTGKTMTVLHGVKNFLDLLCSKTEDDAFAKCLLVLAPTNLVAKAVGGKTIDSALHNRRAGTTISCSKLVKLVLVDEVPLGDQEHSCGAATINRKQKGSVWRREHHVDWQRAPAASSAWNVGVQSDHGSQKQR